MKRPKLEDYGDITYSQYMNDVDEYVNELQAEVADLEKENEQLEDLRVEYSELISELKKENEQLKERIKQLEVEMKYARTFVSSHEKMHKDGLILYDLVLDANDKKQDK